MYNFIKYIRNSTVLISYVTLVIMAVRFKDYNLINNKLLEDLQKQHLELREMLDEDAGWQGDSDDGYNSTFSADED